jgi:DNA-binding transcriptional LysR family regulator
MLEIKPLYYFIAAYEEGSITAAANRCFIAQPSITHAIKALESNLSVQLFTRSKQGIKPTKEGHKLYKLASDLVLQSQQIKSEFTPNQKNEIHLYIQPDINVEQYASVIESVKSADANIEITVADALEQSQLAIIDELRVPAQFSVKRLHQEGYKLVVKQDHPLAKHQDVSLNEFEQLTFIERPYCTQKDTFLRLINEQQFNITYKGKAIHDKQLLGLVKLGLGVAVIPESYTEEDGNLSYLKIRTPNQFTRSIVLAYRKVPESVVETIKGLTFFY